MEPPTVRRSSRILINAVKNKNHEAVINLLRRGSDVNGVNYSGNSPLHYAVKSNNFKMVELLLEYNAEVDIDNECGERPYDIAFQKKKMDLDIIRTLLQYKAQIPIHHIAIIQSRKYPEDLKKLYYKNVNVENADYSGFTALHHAVKSNDLNGIKMLLSRGADVNKFSWRSGYTPLHCALSTECIRILLRGGANPNIKDEYSCSPLYTLAMRSKKGPVCSVGREEQQRMIEELIRNNADCVEVIYCGQIALGYGVPENSKYGLKDVLRFMALKEHERHYADIDYLRLKHEYNVLGLFYRQCLKEVMLLKEEKLSDYLTYYDFVAKNIPELSKYVNNNSIVKAFKNKSNIISKFPIYCKILWRHFNEATEERRLRETACLSMSYAIPYINASHIVTYKILKLLEVEDMQNLVEAFPTVKIHEKKISANSVPKTRIPF